MGKGKRSAYKAFAEHDKKMKAISAVSKIGEMASNIMKNPDQPHDLDKLRTLLDTLYYNTRLSSAPKEMRSPFIELYNQAKAVLEDVSQKPIVVSPSILDRPLRGSISDKS